MPETDDLQPLDWRRVLSWPRIRFTLILVVVFALLFRIGSPTSLGAWICRMLIVAPGATLAYGLLEQRPVRPPSWLARWVMQLLGVVVSVPLAAYVAYWATTGDAAFWHDRLLLGGYGRVVFSGILLAPWMALTAMVRQREALARHQALAFELERSELRRQALDARLSLLQAQVQPHFLFNTLANIRALVRSGSPRAAEVLDSLIAYLRAAVPRLDENSSTLGQELDLVRAYLELMHLRIPDRLRYAVHDDGVDRMLRCPALTLITLVENAIRHGIDPAEDGGQVEVSVQVRQGRCIARVVDSGVGLREDASSPGTGLASLRERLQLFFGGDARLSLSASMPHGVSAEVDFPAIRSVP